MSQVVYIQINQNIEVDKRDIHLGDIAQLICSDKTQLAKLKNIKITTIPDVSQKRVCFSIIDIIQLIENICPQLEVNNIGESDFVIDYIKQKKKNVVLEYMLIGVVSLITFVGSSYSIMAYNNDVSTVEIFEKLYGLFNADFFAEYKVIEISYAIGLAGGIIIFYNHFVGKRFSKDPTPMEVEMDKYKKDLSTTIIERKNDRDNQVRRKKR